MTNSTALILGLVALIVALLINRILFKRIHSLLNYCIGLIPFLAAWLLYMLPLPSSVYCQQNPLACEWTGMGALFFTGYLVLLAVVYSALSITMHAYYHRTSLQDSQTGAEKRRIIARSAIILPLIAFPVLSGSMCFLVIELVLHGVFVGWHSLGNPLNSWQAGRLAGEFSERIYSYTLEEIYVETNTGRIFQADLDFCLEKKPSVRQDCWNLSPVKAPFKSESMACKQELWIRNPPGESIERAQIRQCDDISINQTNYALLADGNVLAWHYYVSIASHVKAIVIIAAVILGLLAASLLIRFQLLRVKKS
jgi:hypothetical protein